MNEDILRSTCWENNISYVFLWTCDERKWSAKNKCLNSHTTPFIRTVLFSMIPQLRFMNQTLIVLVHQLAAVGDRYNLNVKSKSQDNGIASTLLEYYFAGYSAACYLPHRGRPPLRTKRSTSWCSSSWGQRHRIIRRRGSFVTKTGQIYCFLYFVVFTMWTFYFGCQQWRENFNFNEPLSLNVILLHCDGKFSFIFHVFNIQARAKGSLMVCAWKKRCSKFHV